MRPRPFIIAGLVLALFVAGVFAACGSNGGAGGGEPGKVKLGLVVEKSYDIAIPSKVAQEQGFFEDEGLTVERVSFQGGADLVKAIASGGINIGSATGLDAAGAAAKQVPLTAFAGFMQRSPMVIIAAADGKVRSVDDLKGTTIGVTRFGSLTDFVVRNIAREQGLDPEKDLKIVALGGAPEQTAALERGETDAFVWSTELGYQLEKTGDGKIVARFADMFPTDQYGVLVASPEYLEGNKETADKFLRAYFRAIRWMKDNPQGATRIASRALELPPDVTRETHQALAANWTPQGRISTAGLQAYAKALPELKVAPEAPDVKEFSTTEFIPVGAR